MTHRWIIRGFCLALMTLCIVAWIYHSRGWGGLYYRSGYWIACTSGSGEICMAAGQSSLPMTSSDGWLFLREHIPRCFSFPGQHFLGFWFYSGMPTLKIKALCVPYWFILCVLALTTIVVWRYTCLKPGRGFPVVLDQFEPQSHDRK